MSIAKKTRAALALASLVAVSACGSWAEFPNKQAGDSDHPWNSLKNENVYGDQGSSLFDWGPSSGSGKGENPAIGINAYLWRASLDTLAFLPLASADPFGGTIITDWYAPPESPNERFKMSVYITDRDLHADGIHVSVFRQVKSNGNDWTDAPVTAKTATDLENAILTRARELRTLAVAAKKS